MSAAAGSMLITDVQRARGHWHALVNSGAVHEVRIPKVRKNGPRRFWGPVVSGYFDNVDDFAAAVTGISGNDAEGVYLTLSPVNPALIARAANRLKDGAKETTADVDVLRRTNFLLDFDPARPSGISATDEERDAALVLRDHVLDFLSVEMGWPAPAAIIETGNGAGLIYRVNLKNDPEHNALVQQILTALAALFNSPAVTVDTATYNAARIAKIAGSVAAKGDHVADRPWRLATATYPPDAAPVLPEFLARVADLAPEPVQRPAPLSTNRHHPERGWDIRDVLQENAIGFKEKDAGYGTVFSLDRCLTSGDHTDGAAIIEMSSGALVYRCLHNRCAGKEWPDIRPLLGLEAARRSGRITVAGLPRKNAPDPENFEDGEDSEDASWPDPIPLLEGDRPPFPTTTLPQMMREFVEALAEATQTPAALAAIMVIVSIAAAAAKQFVVRVRAGWLEPVNLYGVVALDSGNRKSAVLREVAAPLRAYEREQAQNLALEIAQVESRRKIAEKALERAQRDAANPDSTNYFKARGDADQLVRDLIESPEFRVPRSPRLLVDDITPEKLAAMMVEHGGRMAVLSAEGGLFDIMSGRFSKDGKAPSLDLFLRGHAGDDLPVDRLGRQGGVLTSPALSLGLAVQTYVLQGLARRPGFRGTGLLARFLFALPTSFVGSRVVNPPPVPSGVATAYAAAVEAILAMRPTDTEAGEPEPIELALSPEAAQHFLAFERALEPRLGAAGDLGHVADWGGKLAGLVARLAGLFHVASCATRSEHDHTWGTPIPGSTMQNAIALAHDFIIPHALTAFGEMGADPVVEDARVVWRAIERLDDSVFSRRDLHQRSLKR